MKKSTLFFKVMVLMALLVPWTAWGQETPTAFSTNDYKRPNVWTNKIGTITIYMDNDGNLSKSEKGNFTSNITVKTGDIDFTKGHSQEQSWYFLKAEHSSGNDNAWTQWTNPSEHLIQTKVADKSWNKNLQLSNNVGNNNIPKDNFTYKVAVYDWKGGYWVDEGYVLITVKTGAGKTNISTDEDIKIDFSVASGSKTYDGQAVEVTVKDGGTKLGKDSYTIAITKDGQSVNEIKDAGNYKVAITGKGKYKGTKTADYTVKKADLTVSLKEDLKATVGEERPLTHDDFTVTGLKNNETVTVSTTATVNTATAGQQSIEISKENVTLTAGNGFNENNYAITYKGGNVTVSKKTINAEDVKVYFGEQQATAAGISVPYDGNAHGVTKVMVGDDELAATEYTVSYQNEYTKESSTDAPVHVACSEPTSTVYKYVATITIKSDKYEVSGTVTAGITISRIYLNIEAKASDMEMKWENGEMVLTASEYLKVSGAAGSDAENISITGDLTAAADGENYKLTKGENTSLTFSNGAQAGDYVQEWDAVEAGISVDGGSKPTTSEGEDIVIETEGGESITLTEDGTNSMPYNGKKYKVTKLGDKDLSEVDGETVSVKYNGTEQKEGEVIKNAGMYEITVTYKDEKGNTHTGTQTLTITKVDLTVTIKPQTIYVTDMAKVEDSFTTLGLNVTEDSENATVTIKGEQANDKVAFEEGTTSLSLITPSEGTWKVGQNVDVVQAKELKLDDEYAVNYELKVENGDLNIIFKIDESNKDKVEIVFAGVAEDNTKVYDGQPVDVEKVTVDGILVDAEAYEVSFNENPVNVGTYTATITFVEGSNYAVEDVALTAECKVTKRDLIIAFSFPNPIEEGGVPTLDDAVMTVGENDLVEGETLKDCIDVTFKVSDKQNANKKYDVYIGSISITNSTDESNAFNPTNYKITVKYGDVEVLLEDKNNDGKIDGEDDNDGISDTPVGDIEIINPSTGEGSTGTFYKKYELYLANKDYLKTGNTKVYYESEGLELFSRHDKKTTWAGGSFTIWYEHNGVANDGSYRVFWSKSERGDYQEVKLDEVSGYYQIRNVNSDVYVKLYYETGFPVSNEEITATDARAYAQANKIVVITPEPTDVQIISMAGAVVATDQVTGQREFANLAEGVYIVRMGETVIKLQVRN